MLRGPRVLLLAFFALVTSGCAADEQAWVFIDRDGVRGSSRTSCTCVPAFADEGTCLEYSGAIDGGDSACECQVYDLHDDIEILDDAGHSLASGPSPKGDFAGRTIIIEGERFELPVQFPPAATILTTANPITWEVAPPTMATIQVLRRRAGAGCRLAADVTSFPIAVEGFDTIEIATEDRQSRSHVNIVVQTFSLWMKEEQPARGR